MIPGGSAAQPLEAPYGYPITEIFIDFENGICEVGGVAASLYDLIDGLDPSFITEAGLALTTTAIKAKGELFRTLRNAITQGALVVIEYEARDGGKRNAECVFCYFDTDDPYAAQGLAIYTSSSNGFVVGDPYEMATSTGGGAYAGASPSTGYVQRCAVALGMTSPLSSGIRYWSVSMNGSAASDDSVAYRINAARVKRIDLFGSDVSASYVAARWNVRKLHIMPLPFEYPYHTAGMQEYSNRLTPVSPPASGLGKDHGGKTEYHFGPFPLGEAAASNRLVVAALVFESFDGSAVGATAVTFDGVAAECVASNSQMEVWQLLVSSGSTIADIKVTFADDMKFCVCKVVDFITDETVPHDAKAGSSAVGANVVLSDLAARDGGRVLAMMKAPAADSSTTWTWGGAETPAVQSFNMNDLFAVSLLDIEPAADATGNDLTCDAPAGATTDVYVMAVSWAPAAVTNDPNWSDVKLLLGFDGTDAATTFTAEESSPHTLTFVGNAQLDTDQAKFGSASLLLDGTGDYVTTPDSADWDIASGAFTVEMEVRFNAATTMSLIGQWISSTGNRSWLIERNSSGGLYFYLSTTGSNTVTVMSGSPGFTTGVWYHVRVSFDGTTYRLYVDGVQIASSTTVSTAYNTAAVLSVGGKGNGTEPFNGWIDEVRFTKGVCRNPGLTRFRRPAAAFPRA